MFGRLAALALSAAALNASPSAFAAQTLEVLSGTISPRAVTVSNGAIGQSFTAFTDTLTSVGFQFSTLNPTAANSPLSLAIYGGEALSGAALFSTTFTLPGTITDRTPTWFDIALPSLAITNGNIYSLVLTGTSTRAAVVLGPGFDSPSGTFFGGDAYAGGKLLSNWSGIYPNCTGAANNCDLNFRVTGESFAAAVPEPGTWMTLILGFGLAGVAVRRSRRRGLPLRAAH
jgi:hypothetical protein